MSGLSGYMNCFFVTVQAHQDLTTIPFLIYKKTGSSCLWKETNSFILWNPALLPRNVTWWWLLSWDLPLVFPSPFNHFLSILFLYRICISQIKARLSYKQALKEGLILWVLFDHIWLEPYYYRHYPSTAHQVVNSQKPLNSSATDEGIYLRCGTVHRHWDTGTSLIEPEWYPA